MDDGLLRGAGHNGERIPPRSVMFGKFLVKALDRTQADEQYSAAPPFPVHTRKTRRTV